MEGSRTESPLGFIESAKIVDNQKTPPILKLNLIIVVTGNLYTTKEIKFKKISKVKVFSKTKTENISQPPAAVFTRIEIPTTLIKVNLKKEVTILVKTAGEKRLNRPVIDEATYFLSVEQWILSQSLKC